MGEGSSPRTKMPGPGPAWRQGPGGPWTPTSRNFIQHQLHHALNLWRLGHPAVFHLESQSDGRAKLNLSFCLPLPVKSSPLHLLHSQPPLSPQAIHSHPSAPSSLCFLEVKSPPSSQGTPHRSCPAASASPTGAQCSTKPLKPHPTSLPHSLAH